MCYSDWVIFSPKFLQMLLTSQPKICVGDDSGKMSLPANRKKAASTIFPLRFFQIRRTFQGSRRTEGQALNLQDCPARCRTLGSPVLPLLTTQHKSLKW